MGPVGVVIDAACWGAVIGGASYSIGAGGSWTWSGFGNAIGLGAISGALSGGMGALWSPVGALPGAAYGAATNVLSTAILNGSKYMLDGKNFWEGIAKGNNYLSAAIAGGISGGIRGYGAAKALNSDRCRYNPWTGVGRDVKSVTRYPTGPIPFVANDGPSCWGAVSEGKALKLDPACKFTTEDFMCATHGTPKSNEFIKVWKQLGFSGVERKFLNDADALAMLKFAMSCDEPISAVIYDGGFWKQIFGGL